MMYVQITKKRHFISQPTKRLPGRIEATSIIGHIPREISRVCQFFILRDGELRGRVTSTEFRRSPLPQGGLEIPIDLLVYQDSCTNHEFQMMRRFFADNYSDPEDIADGSEENTDDETFADQ